MPIPSYDLTKLGSGAFEHMINLLAFRVLGAGHTGFGPGPDGGRDGYFEGEAEYPSPVDRWSGKWYIQSKFHTPHLTTDAQKWLLEQIKAELSEFQKPNSRRRWPDNWIVATNIDPSGVPETGAFDAARALVKAVRPKLANHFHIWGGQKVLSLLALHSEISTFYAEFLTPGHILTRIYEQVSDSQAEIQHLLHYFIATQFNDQQYTKLEQAGSGSDTRPGIHDMFSDLPFTSSDTKFSGMCAECLATTSDQNHRVDRNFPNTDEWLAWLRHPNRARVWFIKGGPGQGKSTVAQYICQIQRAALLLAPQAPLVLPTLLETARRVRKRATEDRIWPGSPRVPIVTELRDYAKWYGGQSDDVPRGVLAYLADRSSRGVEQAVLPGTLRRAFTSSRWLFVFDGLDEVPGDVKDEIAGEVTKFINSTLVACDSDALSICTSRPQGYSGQFSALEGASIQLDPLSPDQALACARPVLQANRGVEEGRENFETLRQALDSPAVRELMTTPLQAHIMAVVVRDGSKPPERKWNLFSNFYNVIKRREANRKLPDRKLAAILLNGDRLLKALHNRIGFELHCRAEKSSGAQASLPRTELESIVHEVVSALQDQNITETVSVLMEATTERLVLVNTPESGGEVRFDIRPLQEFFAAEFLYESVPSETLVKRLWVIAGDSHWREVMHFLMSGLIENGRETELMLATEVLANLNEPPDDSSVRSLYKNLALGGLISARLLREGVLEQDKRVRHHFRKCLASLLGSFRAPDLLCDINQIQTKAWLVNVLIDYCDEQSEMEKLGAASVLAVMLSDENPMVMRVIELMKKETGTFIGYLLRVMVQNFVGTDSAPAGWISKIILEWLMSPKWTELGPDGIEAAFTILSLIPNGVNSLCEESNIPRIQAQIFTAFVRGTEYDLPAESRKRTAKEVAGVAKVLSYEPVRELCSESWDEDDWDDLRGAAGVLHAAYSIFDLTRMRSSSALSRVVDAVGGQLGVLEALPSQLLAFFPNKLQRAWEAGCIAHGPDGKFVPTEQDIIEAFKDPSVGFEQVYSFEKSRTRLVDWAAVFEMDPGLVIHAIAGPSNDERGLAQYLSTTAGFERLSNVLEKCPRALVSDPEFWGWLLQLSGPRAEDLRRLLRRAARIPARTYWYMFRQKSRNTAPFEFKLPDDACLLPHLVSVLTHNSLGRPPFSADDLSNQSSVGREIAEFLPRADELWSLLANETLSVHELGATAVAYVLHPGSEANRVRLVAGRLPSFYRLELSPWYVAACAVALYGQFIAEDEVSLKILSELLQASRSDFESRMRLERVLENWREVSRAPVHFAQSRREWQ
jgi:hypothetical protein